jgi:phosphatidylethanolamine-binding protein (PEBP) family uncharacterized protein
MRWTNSIVLVLLVASAAAQSQTRQPASSHVSFKLTSSAFASGGAIPRGHTCDGADQSPELRWNEFPAGTMTFALVMHDPDAPVGDWVHWVAWNIPASSRGMDENFPRQE